MCAVSRPFVLLSSLMAFWAPLHFVLVCFLGASSGDFWLPPLCFLGFLVHHFRGENGGPCSPVALRSFILLPRSYYLFVVSCAGHGGRMAVHAPFLRWDKVPNLSPLSSSTVASYFLETGEGEQVIAAFAVRGSDNRMVYQPSHEFVEDYQGVFNLGHVTVDQCWYLKNLSMPGVAERLPRALQWYFPADGSSTWILLRHGKKAWPVEIVGHEFCKKWDEFHQAHQLEVDRRIVFSCERKWIFHVTMFDKDGCELVFDWSGPASRWQDLPPPSGNLRTACLPSVLVDSHAVMRFIYYDVYGPDFRNVFWFSFYYACCFPFCAAFSKLSLSIYHSISIPPSPGVQLAA
ncbi:hypothetical protein RHMOL_Rhmol02G0223300 [Rhododendron molle]|uniref:Uncharacterized protein n=1 Tax=Rhododendron molle TaxID=49168 RepID=A0ACC0PUP6_RHOML|nr:hypothetical protein RHMOL_Rhmol02G0223300 [Rhododendron molle]